MLKKNKKKTILLPFKSCQKQYRKIDKLKLLKNYLKKIKTTKKTT